MLNTSPPGWLKDVQALLSPEIGQIEADIKAGTLTEAQAKPLLVQAGLRAAGKRLVAQGIRVTSGAEAGEVRA